MRPERGERSKRRVAKANGQEEAPAVAHTCCSFALKRCPTRTRFEFERGKVPVCLNLGRFVQPSVEFVRFERGKVRSALSAHVESGELLGERDP